MTSGASRPFARHHCNGLAFKHHRNRHHAAILFNAFHEDFVFHDDAGVERFGEKRFFARFGQRANAVDEIQGLSGGGAHLGQHQPLVALGGHMQHEVGETEVGEHSPLANEIS